MHTPQTRRCKHPRRLPRRWWMQTICDVSAKTATPPSRGRCPGDGGRTLSGPHRPQDHLRRFDHCHFDFVCSYSRMMALCLTLYRTHGATVTHVFTPSDTHLAAGVPANFPFFKRLGMFVLAAFIFIFGTIPGLLLAPPATQAYGAFITTLGPVALLLCALFAWQHRADLGATFRGNDLRRPLRVGAISVFAVYMLCGLLVAVLGLPREAFMAELFAGLTTWQTLIKLASLMILAPITEELMMRHYALRLFPYERSHLWKWVSVLATSALFTSLHTQYGNWPTLALIFAVGCILALARIASGGLRVPILLHMFAEVIACSLDWTWASAGLYG